ncbi:MAG: hypothetical protein Q9214_006814, partial [Letrouitia sp. 1 TL-2023]
MAPAQTRPHSTASRWISRRMALASIFVLSVLVWLLYPSQPNVDPRLSGRPSINWCRCDESIKNVAII